MSTAKKRHYAQDDSGVRRLAAAAGDEVPKDTTDLGPTTVEMAPQRWDDEAREFKPDEDGDA